jgi:hypothetical protein
MSSRHVGNWWTLATLAVVMLGGAPSQAALVISAGNTPVTVTFDETLAGVNEGPFAGLGFSPTPTTGQLNSHAWSLSGIGGGLPFGGTADSGTLARGTSAGGTTTIGVYAFDVGDNLILGVQPGGSDFTPGSMTLRVLNATGQLVTAWELAYDLFFFNDQPRGNSLNFSYSLDNAVYSPVSDLDFVTPAARDTVPSWQSVSRSLALAASVADGDSLYLRWTGNDLLGSGARDEYGLDNIQVLARVESLPPVTPPAEPPPSSLVPEPSSLVTCSLLGLLGLMLPAGARRRSQPEGGRRGSPPVPN